MARGQEDKRPGRQGAEIVGEEAGRQGCSMARGQYGKGAVWRWGNMTRWQYGKGAIWQGDNTARG